MDELLDDRVSRIPDFVGRPHFKNNPLVEHGDPVCDLVGTRHVVGDDDRGHPHIPLEHIDEIVDGVRPDGIEPGRGLVVEHDFGLIGDGPGQSDALLHPAAELVGHHVLDAVEADLGEALLHDPMDLFWR